MAEIKNVGGKPLPIDQNISKISDDQAKLPNRLPQNVAGETVAERGIIGQPIGLPVAEPTTQNALMPGVVTGRDPSQIIAAEKMRASGGNSATDVLLGLNQQPSTLGVLLAPPGNLEALQHLSPAMRRKILRNLLAKQRGQMQNLIAVVRDDKQRRQSQHESDETEDGSSETFSPENTVYDPRVVRDLEATTRMLDLLDEFLGMQDYTLSQIGTFAQG